MRPMLLVSGLTFAAQLAALGSQLVFAALFGASSDSDAYFAALSLPLYCSAVFISALAVAFIPAFIEVRARDAAVADEFAVGTVNLAVVTLAAAAAIGMLFADGLIS